MFKYVRRLRKSGVQVEVESSRESWAFGRVKCSIYLSLETIEVPRSAFGLSWAGLLSEGEGEEEDHLRT